MSLSLPGGSAALVIVAPSETGAEPGLQFQIKENGGRYSQSAVTGWPPRLQTRTEAMDIILGSGRRGQTFLSWDANRLFELPVSYWSDGRQWINSPGYQDGTADFSRPVNPGCLECHATAIQPLSGSPLTNSYQKETLVTGISCETCHGAGGAHMERHRSRVPSAGQPHDEAILDPARFSRDRKVDLCALCHSGTQRTALAASFTYKPGEPLDQYFRPFVSEEAERPEVHGDQVGLLRRSRCYLASPAMSCSTCHDVHAAERPAAAYADRCLTCHTAKSCGESAKIGPKIANQCIECHMPVQATNVIVSETANRVTRATMRNHWIRVYPKRAPSAN